MKRGRERERQEKLERGRDKRDIKERGEGSKSEREIRGKWGREEEEKKGEVQSVGHAPATPPARAPPPTHSLQCHLQPPGAATRSWPHPACPPSPLSRRGAGRSLTRRLSRAPAASRSPSSREEPRAARRTPPPCLAARGLAGPAPALRSPGPDRKRRRTAWAWRGGRAPGPGRTWARSTRSTSRTNTSTRVRSGPRWARPARGRSGGFPRFREGAPRAPEADRAAPPTGRPGPAKGARPPDRARTPGRGGGDTRDPWPRQVA